MRTFVSLFLMIVSGVLFGYAVVLATVKINDVREIIGIGVCFASSVVLGIAIMMKMMK